MNGSSKQSLWIAVGVGLLAVYAGTSPAASDDGAVEVVAQSCAGCHGTDGRSPGAIPTLAGAPYDILAAKLAAFKAGEVPDATIMTRIAEGYSDNTLDALARYYADIVE